METIERAEPEVDTQRFICNVVPSKNTERDWSFDDSLETGALAGPLQLPPSVDLRAPWWPINNQESTGSCVGWATADGVVRYQMVKAGKIAPNQLLSARHIWMSSKETDEFGNRPQTFIEEAGTSLKAAVDVARKHGTALASELPFHITTNMFLGKENTFYASCAQRKIAAYFNMAKNINSWKTWLAAQRPVLVALQVDKSWDNAKANGGKIDNFQPATVRGGHAVSLVGYRTDGRFIVRNSWGTGWGDGGFGYVSPAYIAAGFFNESYGVTI